VANCIQDLLQRRLLRARQGFADLSCETRTELHPGWKCTTQEHEMQHEMQNYDCPNHAQPATTEITTSIGPTE
jgi:hypothetical protein